MARLLLIASLLFAAGCDRDDVFPRHRYELESGEVIECRFYEETSCGVTFKDCTSDKTYTCQVNVEVL